MADHDLLRIKGWARTVELTAARYGEPLGEDYDRAVEVAREAARIAAANRGQIPVPLPTDPAKVEAAVKKAAAAEAGRHHTSTIAADIAERAELQATRTAIDEAPRVAMMIKTAFDTAVAELAEVARTAPMELHAHSTADDFAAHTRLLSLVDALNLAVASRVQLAPVLDEDLRGGRVLWLFLDPVDNASCAAIRQAVTNHHERLPDTAEDWLRIAAIGASMARPQEGPHRASRFAEALHAVGHRTPDRGMADRTYSEALALVPAEASL